MEKVIIFTDGSCDNRIADCGAAAAVLRYKDQYDEVVSGSWSSSTNNRMELLGIIIGLEKVKKGFEIELTSDSEYCLTMCRQLIQDEPSDVEISMFLNGDLLIRLNKALEKHRGNVEFKWVRGHIGVKDNERCDTLAGEAALWDNPTRDIGSGIAECPELAWYRHNLSKILFLDEQNKVFRDYEQIDFLGNARKMSKKEITQIMRDRGMKPKDIKEYEIDLSYYKKPLSI